MGAILIGHWL